jgi:glycine cleavage system H protein
MKIIDGLYYTEDHEWVSVENNIALIGITDYAQKSLGSIVFAELPEVDTQIAQGDVFGVIESVKAASDIYSPLTGVVKAFNQNVLNNPESINQAPYENWLISIEFLDPTQLDDLMDKEKYIKFIQED